MAPPSPLPALPSNSNPTTSTEPNMHVFEGEKRRSLFLLCIPFHVPPACVHSLVCVRDIAVYPNRIINENSIIILVRFRLICYLLSKLYLMFCIHIHIFVHYRFVSIFQHNSVNAASQPVSGIHN